MEISYTLTRARGARIATMQKDVRLYTVKAGSKDKNAMDGYFLPRTRPTVTSSAA